MTTHENRWTVSVQADPLRVHPVRGIMRTVNWKMAIPFWHRWPIWWVSNYRLMYPKSERQLTRSVKWCQVACDVMNENGKLEQELVARLFTQPMGSNPT